jgi:cell division protein FtsW
MPSTRSPRSAGARHLSWSVWPDPLLWAALALAVLGLVMIASVDAELGGSRDGHAWRHALDLGAAVLLAMGVYRFSLPWVERAGVALLLLALTLLFAVLIPGLGVMVNGAQRYLALGPFRPPLAGPTTLMILIFVATELARQGEGLRRQGARFRPVLALLGLAATLLAIEPNVRAAAVLLIAALLMIGSAGLRPWQLGAMAGLVAVVLTGFTL